LRQTLGTLDGKVIGMLGLAFKPNTDDLRDSPALELIHLLRAEGAQVRAFDPAAMTHAKGMLPDVYFATDAYDCATGCDALALVTDWNEFKELDLERIRTLMYSPVLIDGRNIYDPDEVTRLGFRYIAMGRGSRTVATNGAVEVGSAGVK
jgi:UDPglucose 6-dehydrogenase